ncbi:AEC family transporter [Nocardioides sp. zg-536]|uniref:AEC family transporter n=1 Tax=Nocardioides faecalis TaxID=2803858 RepID=A0A938Y9C2_9ACTN|nr:AEC family transporter [Nocardioides faecalis]MBM9459846.1 AEC family transporter [Nocardioides faecalis]MBS4754477.1 AEC family transporter [Nocardioides faecalis]QVI58914.1 AEC family transporter [Nocardioides faecalis]
MGGVLEGFATIAIVIGCGALLAHLGIIDLKAQRSLSLTSFYLASPALLVTVLEDADATKVLSGPLVATAGGVVITAALLVAVAVWRGLDAGTSVIAALCSAYVNAGNLGIPIAAYALGDASLIVPALLMQLLVLQPLALTVLDVMTSPTRPSLTKVLTRPVTNPLTIGSLLGLVLSLTDTELPRTLHAPLELIGGMAVPAMLIAYGVALRLGPTPGRGVTPAALGVVTVLKMVVQPLVAYLIGRFAVGLDAEELFAVTLLSALPTAQNVFVIALRYDRGVLLARDAIFVSTLASAPVALVISALLA